MDEKVLQKIDQDFKSTQIAAVKAMLDEIKPEHVMAKSDANLLNTHMAILNLSNGNINHVRRYVDAAKVDFRDVIYWSQMEA